MGEIDLSTSFVGSGHSPTSLASSAAPCSTAGRPGSVSIVVSSGFVRLRDTLGCVCRVATNPLRHTHGRDLAAIDDRRFRATAETAPARPEHHREQDADRAHDEQDDPDRVDVEAVAGDVDGKRHHRADCNQDKADTDPDVVHLRWRSLDATTTPGVLSEIRPPTRISTVPTVPWCSASFQVRTYRIATRAR